MDTFDVAVIGSGPAGFSASIYTSRANLSTIQFEGNNPGGQLVTTSIVENFPGFPDGIDGFELVDKMRKQSKKFGTTIVYDIVKNIEKFNDLFKIITNNGFCFVKSVIIASGSIAKKLVFPNSSEFWHKGISACAVCDGALNIYKNNPVAIVGGGDTAMEEALWMTKYASIVYIIHRKNEFRASKIMQKKVFDNKKIQILWNFEILKVEGNDLLEKIFLKNNINQEEKIIDCNGLFFAIGHEPSSDFVKNLVDTHNGYIKTGINFSTGTSTPGVFACGDVQDHRYKQAITACGSGCQAAIDVNEWLNK